MPEEGTLAPSYDEWLRSSYRPILGADDGPPSGAETPITEAPETDTPESGAIDWELDDNPYKKRYGDLRPEYDRTNQEVAQYRQVIEDLQSDDPDKRVQAAQRLGLEFEDDAPDPDEFVDPTEELRQQIAELRDWKTQSETEQQTVKQREAEVSFMDDEFTKLERAEEREFTDDEVILVGRVAQSMRDADGRPDVEGAYKALQGFTSQETQRRVKTKRSPQVQSGSAAEKEFDFSDRKARREAMTASLVAHGDE